MPELPEAETIARQLHQRLAGRRLGDTILSRADIVRTGQVELSEAIPMRRVTSVWRRGKRVVVELDPAGLLVFGLGMTGRLSVVPTGTTLETHTHLQVSVLDDSAELRFRDPRRFGGVWWYDHAVAKVPGNHSGDLMDEYGVEPLTCTTRVFRDLLARKRQVKALLMDQRCLAGLGNIYCDESLHAARIHPLTIASSLKPEERRRLLQSIKRVLCRAIRHKGSTLMDFRDADGREGGFQRSHRVYGRDGEPCKTCNAIIVRIVATGRSTHFCPVCQRTKRGR